MKPAHPQPTLAFFSALRCSNNVVIGLNDCFVGCKYRHHLLEGCTVEISEIYFCERPSEHGTKSKNQTCSITVVQILLH